MIRFVFMALGVLALGGGALLAGRVYAHGSWPQIVLVSLLILVLGVITTAVIFYKTAKRNVKHKLDCEVEIRGRWTHRIVYLHFYHWLPKTFRAFDVTLDNHLWFRDGPPEGQAGHQAGAKGVTQRWMVGHALSHFADQEREDTAAQDSWVNDVIYYFKSGWHRLFHSWSTREEEVRANIREESIAAGTSTIVRASRLLTWFPTNDRPVKKKP